LQSGKNQEILESLQKRKEEQHWAEKKAEDGCLIFGNALWKTTFADNRALGSVETWEEKGKSSFWKHKSTMRKKRKAPCLTLRMLQGHCITKTER